MNLKNDHALFRTEIRDREIQQLVHFTRFESVTAIVGDGRILPRNQLHNVSVEWQELIMPNAEQRRDDPRNLNTSITHANIYLLNIFRDRWFPGSRFCVLGINPKYIYHASTTFSISNATYRPARLFGIRGDLATFQAMFGPRVEGRRDRGPFIYTRSNHLPNNLTTDPEAEVLINCEIPYSDVLFIACRNQFEHDLLASTFDVLNLPTEKLRVDTTIFEFRR